jgi:hypothetical protein
MSEPSVSVAVMTVPERSELLDALLPKLDAVPEIVSDPTHAGHWTTARRAWEVGLTSGTTHHLVLEDDIDVVPDLIAGLEAMLFACPSIGYAPVSLFGISKVIREAYESGHTFLKGNGISWAQALMLPAKVIPLFLAWCEAFVRPDYRWGCGRLSLFAMSQGYPIHTTAPCLVEHLDVPSAVGNPRLAGGQHERRAAVFTGQSALEVPWAVPGLARTTHRISDYTEWRLPE